MGDIMVLDQQYYAYLSLWHILFCAFLLVTNDDAVLCLILSDFFECCFLLVDSGNIAKFEFSG